MHLIIMGFITAKLLVKDEVNKDLKHYIHNLILLLMQTKLDTTTD